MWGRLPHDRPVGRKERSSEICKPDRAETRRRGMALKESFPLRVHVADGAAQSISQSGPRSLRTGANLIAFRGISGLGQFSHQRPQLTEVCLADLRIVHLQFPPNLSPGISEPAPIDDPLRERRQSGEDLARVDLPLDVRLTGAHRFEIYGQTIRVFAPLPVHLVFGMTANFALNPSPHLDRSRIRMTGDVFGRVLNRMVHQIVGGGVVIQECPGAQQSVRPCCVSSGLQYLIRRRVSGRAGPTPCQLLPSATLWRHSRASARRGRIHQVPEV